MFVSSTTPYSSYANVGKALYFRKSRVSATTTASDRAGADELRELSRLTQQLRRAAERINPATNTRLAGTTGGLVPKFLQSAESLQISTEMAAAELRSTGEINAVATSFTPREPEFNGASTSDPLVGGVYDGSQGDDTLTFEVMSSGFVGLTQLQVEVRDSSNQLVDTLSFALGYSAGTEVALNNGLTVALSDGFVTGGDSFEVDVSTTVGSAVNTQNAFNGTGNANPNFDPGGSVGAGTFEVNSVLITVAANDSINSVLAKINASGAGVAATFDSVSERIVLAQTTPGSAESVVVGSDTSGFLAATKLDLAAVQAGTDDERAVAIGSVAALAGVSSGSFSVNGVSLSVDVLTDSLNDVIARINAAAAGVSAEFDVAERRVSIQSQTGSTMTLSDGSSGLFSMLGIQPGAYEPAEVAADSSVRFRDGRKLRRRLGAFGDALEDLLRARFSREIEPAAAVVRESLRGAFAGAFDRSEAATSFSTNGLRIDFSADASDVFKLSTSTLRRAMKTDASDVFSLLARQGEGLLPRLKDAFAQIDGELAKFSLSASGSLVDLTA